MWVLDCEGDALEGKRLWLRPGKRFIFGRTKGADGQIVVADKTISRSHLELKVDDVQPADCAKVTSRSCLTLIDGCGVINKDGTTGTKIGTLLNGEQIRGKRVVLNQDENALTLGKYKHRFRLNWVPITFTFSFTTKELKSNPYPALYESLGLLDIKVLTNYEREHTTHVVAKKRNTSKGLQALINGGYIVHNDSYIQAILAAATPNDAGQSPLEEDFAQHFPDPLKFLPQKGEEPTECAADAYSPNASRQNMFSGYTFIIYEQRQLDNLLAPITEGGGKAMFREVIADRTTVEDFVGYVKSVAGEKGLGELEDGDDGKGVVVVRYNPVKGAGSEWYTEFARQVSLHLDHRLIEQNEFLDAILGNDASVLKKPLELEASGVMAPPPTAATVVATQSAQRPEAPAPTLAQDTAPEPSRRGRSRRVRPQFTGFEDDFSGAISSGMAEPQPMIVDQEPPAETQPSQSLFLTQDPDQEIPPPPESQSRASRKRPTPVSDEEDFMEVNAPATTAYKKRRLENESVRRQRNEPIPPPPATPAPVTKEEPKTKSRSMKVKQEVDIVEIARQQRLKVEAMAKAERDALQSQFDDTDIAAIRDLVIVEDMEVKRSSGPQAASMDPRWKERKNFKKFHSNRNGQEKARRVARVIVPLEEAKKRDFGIGDHFWDKDDSQRSKKGKGKGKGRETQDSQMVSQSAAKSQAAKAASRILANEAEDEVVDAGRADHDSDSDVEIVPRARAGRPQTLVDKTNRSQNLPTNKRAAATTLTKPAAAKKAKTAFRRELEPDSDEDSDDGLKFKFRKKA